MAFKQKSWSPYTKMGGTNMKGTVSQRQASAYKSTGRKVGKQAASQGMSRAIGKGLKAIGGTAAKVGRALGPAGMVATFGKFVFKNKVGQKSMGRMRSSKGGGGGRKI